MSSGKKIAGKSIEILWMGGGNLWLGEEGEKDEDEEERDENIQRGGGGERR